jgi:hypothetical protein
MPWVTQQRLHAHSVREPLAFETFQLPMQVPGVFFFHARHAHYAPAAALAR